MDERILNLFNLCRLAQEKGHKLEFVCGKDYISIWCLPGTVQGMKHYLVDLLEINEQQFVNAEEYLKGLISSVG